MQNLPFVSPHADHFRERVEKPGTKTNPKNLRPECIGMRNASDLNRVLDTSRLSDLTRKKAFVGHARSSWNGSETGCRTGQCEQRKKDKPEETRLNITKLTNTATHS